MKIVKLAFLIAFSALAMNCGGDKPPTDPSTAVDQDAAPPATPDPASATSATPSNK